MTTADWVVVAIVAVMALQGFARGFIVGVLSLIGFAGGAWIGTRVGPLLLSQGAHSPYASLFGLGGALVFGFLLGAFFDGIAWRVRSLLRMLPGLSLLDRIGGALLTGAVGLGFVWLAGAALVQSGGLSLPLSLRSDIQRSTILRELDKVLPPSGGLLNELARVDPLPGVSGSTSDITAPDASILNVPAVGAAASSVVRVTGDACGLGVEGSGWVIAPDTVVTNAHVVAGEDNTTVQIDGNGIGLPAQLRLLDVHNDVAVLHVSGLNVQALPLASGPVAGSSAAILGYPQDGPFNVQAARLGTTQDTETENAYGQGPVLRSITSLRGLVRPGNSGGPLIDAGGDVVGMIFAEETDAPAARPAGFAVPGPVVAADYAKVKDSDTTVSSGSCAD
jgi:hypothetical protein